MKDTKQIDEERRRRGNELARDLRDAISFPPLPPSPAEVGDLILQTREHVQALGWGNREALYTESQVRAIMSECANMAAAREQRHCVELAARGNGRKEGVTSSVVKAVAEIGSECYRDLASARAEIEKLHAELSSLEMALLQTHSGVAVAIATERERCAKVCDVLHGGDADDWSAGAKECAARIRASLPSDK
jgi:hypothetical protein